MHGDEDKSHELFEEVERRAYMELPEEDGEDDVDLISSIGSAETVDPGEAKDLTLGGYIKLHNRPPAFSGTDDQPYTVDIDVEETDDRQRPYAAFFVFIRWAETGAGIMQHVESDDVAFGDSPDAARDAALELTLYEVKSELDASIARKAKLLEE